MSSDTGKGFNVAATPFQPRARANSGGKAAVASATTTIPSSMEGSEVAAAKKVESYSDRAKKAVEKDKATAAAAAAAQKKIESSTTAAAEVKVDKIPAKISGASSAGKNKVTNSPEKKPVAAPAETKKDGQRGKKDSNTSSKKHVTIPLRYTRERMKELKASTWKWQLDAVVDEERVDHPPFSNIPKSYAKFFECRAHLDWINWESPLMHVPSSSRRSRNQDQKRAPPAMIDDAPALPPATAQSDYQQQEYKHSRRASGGSGTGSNRGWGISPGLTAITTSPYSRTSTPDLHGGQLTFHCTTCASPESSCCETVSNLIQAIKRKEKEHGGFLTQSGDVVLGSVQILLVFEHRATSRRMKLLHERFPKVQALVKAYLCGEGFHIPPPALNNDEVWSRLLGRLKFDYIRDNRTKVFTELSKHWKRSHTKFEQFAHFAAFRDAVPYFPTIGMITNTQKPLLVSCSTGDIDSTVLLGELGYQVMADVFWDMLPYYDDLSHHSYAILRHLCVYYFKRQQRRVRQTQAQLMSSGASPALPPMSYGTSPLLMSGVGTPMGGPGQGPPPSPALRPAGVTH